MAKVHVVMKGYDNGASVIHAVYSSKKKAQAYVDAFIKDEKFYRPVEDIHRNCTVHRCYNDSQLDRFIDLWVTSEEVE